MNEYVFQAAIIKDGQVVAQYSRILGAGDDGKLYLSDEEELTDGQAIAGFGHALLLASATIDDEPLRVEQPQQTGFVVLPFHTGDKEVHGQ